MWVALYTLMVLFLLFLVFFNQSLPDFKLHVSFLDIGQGDAILITTPNGRRVLIDGGPQSHILQALPQKLSYFDDQIDLVILSHPDSDHMSGLIPVLQRYDVTAVMFTGMGRVGDEYKAFWNLIGDRPVFIAQDGHDIQLDREVYLDVLYPDESLENVFFEKDINDTSVILRLVYGETSFLFTGDASTDIEEKILASGDLVESHVLKVGHHGSITSTSKSFLQLVDPSFAAIQAGKENSFGHPHYEVVNRLRSQNVQVYGTYEFGTIDFICGPKKDCRVNWKK